MSSTPKPLPNLFSPPSTRVGQWRARRLFGRRRSEGPRTPRIAIACYGALVAFATGAIAAYGAWSMTVTPGAGDAVRSPAAAVVRIRTVPRSPRRATAPTPTWRRYAAAWPPADGRPMVAVVIDDIGLHERNDPWALSLRGPLTLALLPYGRDLEALSARARANGHEVLIHLPMEPDDMRRNPGPQALLNGLGGPELARRLTWNLTRFTGYVGINNHMGSRFTRDRRAMRPVIEAAAARGLLFVDSRTTGDSVAGSLSRRLGVPHVDRDIFLDNDRSAVAIRSQLAALEALARRRGWAVAIGHPHAVTLAVLEPWLAAARGRGLQLVPVSRIAAGQNRRTDHIRLAAAGLGSGLSAP